MFSITVFYQIMVNECKLGGLHDQFLRMLFLVAVSVVFLFYDWQNSVDRP